MASRKKSPSAATSSATPENQSARTPGPKLFDQQPGEKIGAYTAFRIYLDLRAERSLAAVARKVRKSSKQMAKWSSRWNWVERSKAWDIDQEEERRKAGLVAMADEAKVWERRQREIREADYQLAVALREKAKAMLEYPLAKRVVMEGDTQVHIHPARWSIGQAARMVEASSMLARLSAGMATEKTEITGPDNQPLQSFGEIVILELPDNGRGKKAEEE